MNGEKGMLTEGGIRVPFVVCWKGTIPGGQVYSHPVITLDVGATACALAGLPDDPVLDGVNLLPYLTGTKDDAPHDVLYWRWLGQSAIRKGKWKYLRSDNREYLFDMEKDFEETDNLLSCSPEIAAELQADLKAWAATQTPPGIWAMKSAGMSRAADRYFRLVRRRQARSTAAGEAGGPNQAETRTGEELNKACSPVAQSRPVSFFRSATRPQIARVCGSVKSAPTPQDPGSVQESRCLDKPSKPSTRRIHPAKRGGCNVVDTSRCGFDSQVDPINIATDGHR